MTDDRFEEFLQQEAREYNEPPETPTEAIWAGIEAQRRAKRLGERDLERQTRPWYQWGIGIAAVLALGIGLGIVIERQNGSGPVDVAVGDAGSGAEASQEVIFRAAAAEYIGRTDAFLTLFRAEAETGRADSEVTEWARDLLTTARLMMDSPIAGDPNVRALLEDLELVLVQIAQYSPDQGAEELELIEEGIDERGLLLRMRSILSEPEGGALAQGEL